MVAPLHEDPWITQSEAAAALGVHRQTVASMAARGELKWKTLARILFIWRKDVEVRVATQDRKA